MPIGAKSEVPRPKVLPEHPEVASGPSPVPGGAIALSFGGTWNFPVQGYHFRVGLGVFFRSDAMCYRHGLESARGDRITSGSLLQTREVSVYGLIFFQMQQYVQETLGPDLWTGVVQTAGIPHTRFVISRDYSDAEGKALIEALSKVAEKPAEELLRGFGEYMMPRLLKKYRFLINKDWDAMDLIENTQRNIHRVIIADNPETNPPFIHCSRIAPDRIVIDYASRRRMCHFAEGLIQGIGNHYGESLRVEQPRCMHRNDSACSIEVTRQGTE